MDSSLDTDQFIMELPIQKETTSTAAADLSRVHEGYLELTV